MKKQKNMQSVFSKLSRGQGIGVVLIRGASLSLIVRILGTGLTFITQVVLARVLGAQHFGDYVYVLTWLNVLVLIGKFGMDTTSLRYVPQFKVRNELGLLKGFLIRSLQVNILSTLILGLGLVCIIWYKSPLLGRPLVNAFYVGALVLPFMAVLQLYASRLRGLKKIMSAQVPLQLLRPLFVLLAVTLLIVVFKADLNGYQVMILHLIAVLACLGISIWIFHKTLFVELYQIKPIYMTREWIKVSIPLLLISGMNLLMGQMDIIMLGAIKGTEEAGLYSSANRIAKLTLFGLQAVNTMVAPMISELYFNGRVRGLQRIITIASWGIFAITLIGVVFLLFFGHWVLSLFGSEFVKAYVPLVILLIGNVINALCGSVGFLLNMTGNQNVSGRIVSSAVFMNLFLNMLLIPKLGMMGGAIATASTMAYWNLFMCVVVVRKLGINPTVFKIRF